MRVVAIVALILAVPAGQDSRLPVPDEKAQAVAEKTIRDVFKDEFALKTPSAQQKLARKLVAQGIETRDDAASRYILLREALALAGRSGDLDTLARSLDELCVGYAVDAPSLREASLANVEAALSRPEDFKKLAEADSRLVSDFLEADQFDAAARIAQASLEAAKKSKDISLTLKAEGNIRSVADLKGAFEKAARAEKTLEADPADPVANLSRGEYLCLIKGQWEKGLPLLSRGSPSPLQDLARKEASSPDDPIRRVESADGWLELAEREKNAIRKRQMRAHSRSLYEKALPGATGLAKVKIEKRLSELKPVDSGASIRTSVRQGLVAWWKFDEGAGRSVSDSAGACGPGALMNGVQWTTGHSGSALKFNGRDSYVTCKANGLPATNAPQTISWWQYYSSRPGGTESIISLVDGGQTAAVQPGIIFGRLSVWKFGGIVLVSAEQPSLEAWHHVAYSYDGTQHRLYIDGNLADRSDVPPQSGIPARCEFGWWLAGDSYFSGMLDEVRIYSRALTEIEIRTLADGKD